MAHRVAHAEGDAEVVKHQRDVFQPQLPNELFQIISLLGPLIFNVRFVRETEANEVRRNAPRHTASGEG